MLEDLKSAVTRAPETLAADIAGGAALAVLLVTLLHLPGLF
jgi:hypothetical protein